MEDFKIASVFSNNMVLQRNTNICIFGWKNSENSIQIKASIRNKNGKIISTNSTNAGAGNKWILYLPEVNAMENCTLEVCWPQGSKTFTNISIGEVWIAGGQSNMEFELKDSCEGPQELCNKKDPGVRFYCTPKISWMDQESCKKENESHWETWNDEGKIHWSAVGYLFARELAKKLGVTVGVIGCNWGGTSASAWMHEEDLAEDIDLNTYLEEQKEATKGKSIQMQCTEYDRYVELNDQWQIKCNELYSKNPDIEWNEVQKIIGPCLWPGPKSCKNPFRPSGLYNTMLQRICPYSVKGVIFYQGESDDHKPQMYEKLFTKMILRWRKDWNNPVMPFIFVQLPQHRYKQDADFKNWCLIREAQMNVYNSISFTGIAVAQDCGQYNDIHPRSKKTVAHRLVLQAMSVAYKKKIPSKQNGPLYKSHLCNGNSIIIKFDNAQKGLALREDTEELNNYILLEQKQGHTVSNDFTGFEVAAADGVYHNAQVKIGKGQNRNTIELYSPYVKEVASARYAWYNYGPVVLYGKNGIPAAPFRTNSNEEKQNSRIQHAQIQQIMEV